MDLENLESELRSLVEDPCEETFVYDLLLAYGFPKATITRLKKGDYNQSKLPAEILWKKHLYFTTAARSDLFTRIDEAKNEKRIQRHRPRFLIVTDFRTLLAIDTKTSDSLDIPISDLPKHGNFFLPWAGMEKSAITSENPADIKAAEKMGQLYDLLLQNNEIEDEHSRHALNVFLSRLLFCFFAEDTGIFEDDQFTKLVDSHTSEDGSNLQPLLERLFRALNEEDRSAYPDYIQAFPYVNGGLFSDELPVPIFGRKARKMLIDCGALNWQAINPDIFGSMMQAVTLGEERSSIGMHYTSVVNIMKVIEPLFLNELKEQLEQASGNEKKLGKLLDRLYHIRIFDPACGSGNFLIIAYKELCRLEIEIFRHLQELNPRKWGFARSGLQLKQIFGIEVDDFATEIAQLSLWLAEHQMNIEFRAVFGDTRATLPLSESANIVCGNAASLDWAVVCPRIENVKTYILGNPPYLGYVGQSAEQKKEVRNALHAAKNTKYIDYIAVWFVKAAEYVDSNSEYAFVTTSSICQGTQVSVVWRLIIARGLEIGFAYKEFVWSNSARGNAGVTCSIVGVRKKSRKNKFLFNGNVGAQVKNISPYLVPGQTVFVERRQSPISQLPKMNSGNQASDGGNLILSQSEKEELLAKDPNAGCLIHELVGAKEFIQGLKRYCIWIDDSQVEFARTIAAVAERIEKVKAFRESGGKISKSYAHVPHRFYMVKRSLKDQIIVPRVSSERRKYIPIGILPASSIVADSAQVIFDAEPWVFGVITSRIHMVWARTTGGRLRSDYRYSAITCYNTFPLPTLSDDQKERISEFVYEILDCRERYSELTFGELYDPDQMPEELLSLHAQLDRTIDRCYSSSAFVDDTARLEHLFALYSKLTAEEREAEYA